jgi:phage-related protein
MALNFLGLGFSLGAEDKGLGKAIKETSAGLADIGKSVIGIGLSSAKMILTPPKFGPSVAMAQTLANDIKLTTTGIEAFGVAASKATSAGLAGLNMTEKEFKAAQGMISSTAFSMNTDVGAVTKSFTALKQSSVDVRKVGFKSFQDYQKFIEVTGTDSVAFASAIGTMNTQMKMTPRQVENSLKSVAAIGKKFNIGREAVAGMADTVKILNNNAKLLPQNWGPDKMANFLKGTTIVAGALTAVGMTADEAMTASRKLTEKLLEGSTGLSGMYAGLETTLPDVYTVVTENLGDMESAFKMLSQSPDQFILKMGTVVDKVNKMNLDPKNMDRFRLQMEKTFGPDVMATFTKEGFSKIGPAIKDASKPIKGQNEILQDLSKRYKDGRTYAERFAIAQDMVQTKLKQVHGVMSDSTYLKEYNAQSKDFLKTVNRLADKGGALGKLTTSMIEVKNRGFGGFLASRSSFGFAMAEGLKLIAPMLQYLPALAVAFKALMSPITLVAGAFAGLFFLFKDLGKGDQSVVRAWVDKMAKDAPRLWEKAKEIFSKAFDVIVDVVKQIPWAKVGQTLIDGFAWAFSGIIKVIDMIDWGKVGDLLGKALKKMVELAFDLAFKAVDLIGRLIDWLTALDWGKVGGYIGKVIVGLFALAVDFIWTVIKRIPDMFVAIVKLVIGILGGIEEKLKEAFPRLAGIFTVVFGILKTVAIPLLVALAAHFVIVGVKAVYAAITSAAAWVKATYQIVAGSLSMVATQAQLVFAFLATKVASLQTGLAMAKAWVIGLGPIAWIVAAVAGLAIVIYKFGDDIKAFFGHLWDAVKFIFKAAWDVIVAIVTAPFKAIKIIWGAIKGFFSGLWDALKSAVSSPWEAIKSIILAPITIIKLAWGAITGFFGGLWDGLKSAAGSAWDWIKGKASGAWEGIKGAVSGTTGGPSLGSIVQTELDKVKKKTEEVNKLTAQSTRDAMNDVKAASVGVKVQAIDSAGQAGTAVVDANVKTSKMVDEYVKQTKGHLAIASKLQFPKIGGDQQLDDLQAFMVEFQKMKDVNAEITAADPLANQEKRRAKVSDELVQKFKDQKKVLEDLENKYQELHGTSATVAANMLSDTQDKFKVLTGYTSKMAQVDADHYKQRIENLQNYYAKELSGMVEGAIQLGSYENMKTDAGKAAHAAYIERFKEVEKKRDEEIAGLQGEIDMWTGAAKATTDWGKATREQINATTNVLVDKFAASSDVVAKKWGRFGPAGEEITRGLKQIDEGYASAILKLSTASDVAKTELAKNTKLSADEVKKQQDLIAKNLQDGITSTSKFYQDQKDVLTKQVDQYAIRLKSASKDVQVAIAAEIKTANDQIADDMKKTTKKGVESAAIVAQEFKLSGAEAADAVGKIAVIDPQTFRTNIRIVREETMAFLKKLDVEAQKLVKDTDKSINTFWEHSKKGWNDQEALIKTFSEKAVAHTEKYWTKVLDEASRATTAFANLFKSIQSNLISMAKAVNVMDLLASPSQISRWAASVVAALSYAFRTGGAMDAQIAAAYNKALEASSAATPDTAGTKSPAAPATSQQAMLLNAINRPVWATEEKQLIPSQLIEMNEQLKQTLAQLKALAETKSAGRAGGKSISPKS